ncbi:hypothetical protein HK104_007357 [Borealophlyctis nickersoniae]|nr:hypothetical protein HK104_007357 [Borealophlyctis nickersoniae]
MSSPLTIYHNSACSKSRGTLAFLNDDAKVNPEIVDYIHSTPPPETLHKVVSMLLDAGYTHQDIVRVNNENLSTVDAVVARIAAEPAVMQRPIVVNWKTGQARIGRPDNERIKEIL